VNPVGLIWVVLLVGMFYFLFIRPQRARQRAQQQMTERLVVGTRVMTTSGLFAEVVGVDDDAVLLEASPGVTTRWTKAAVSRILPEPDAEDDSEETEPDADEPAFQADDAGAPDDADAPAAPAAPAAPEADSTDRPT
jgi:preprotein translocase subunit YajC